MISTTAMAVRGLRNIMRARDLELLLLKAIEHQKSLLREAALVEKQSQSKTCSRTWQFVTGLN